ncbi:hypothetical protein [Flyfo microvirus Tbat2_112]|nr:hypothetical protein [Flyfo microvirus Tbat2_112]
MNQSPKVEAGSYGEALKRLAVPTFFKTEKWQAQQWRAVRDGAWEDLKDFEKAFVRRMQAVNVPVFAHNMVRTSDEQDALFVRGVSKAKGGQSAHNHGCAVDIIHSLRGWDLTPKEWEIFGHIGKEVAFAQGVAMEWGGDWKFYDPAHWQLKDWKGRIDVPKDARRPDEG